MALADVVEDMQEPSAAIYAEGNFYAKNIRNV